MKTKMESDTWKKKWPRREKWTGDRAGMARKVKPKALQRRRRGPATKETDAKGLAPEKLEGGQPGSLTIIR